MYHEKLDIEEIELFRKMVDNAILLRRKQRELQKEYIIQYRKYSLNRLLYYCHTGKLYEGDFTDLLSAPEELL